VHSVFDENVCHSPRQTAQAASVGESASASTGFAWFAVDVTAGLRDELADRGLRRWCELRGLPLYIMGWW
jgi:hypothetical protein